MFRRIVALIAALAVTPLLFAVSSGGFPSMPQFQRIGLGAAPSALWGGGYASINGPGGFGGFAVSGTGGAFNSSNAYFDGTNWRCFAAGAAGLTQLIGANLNVYDQGSSTCASANSIFTPRLLLQTSATNSQIWESCCSAAGLKFTATVDGGSFTMTANGTAGPITVLCVWARSGYHADLRCPTIAGTSNAITFTLTGLPAALFPQQNVQMQVGDGQCADNGVQLTVSGAHGCTAVLNAAGTITLFKDNNSNNWTSSGGKSIGNINFGWQLN